MKFKPYIGQITTARQLIRHRNIMLGLPLKKLREANIPWGFEDDPDREGWLRPVQKHLEALYYARTFYSRSTREQRARWVTEQTGVYMSRDTLRIIERYRPPLSAYLLDLNDRLQIATAQTEEAAIKYDNTGAKWHGRAHSKNEEKYRLSREEAVERKAKARVIKNYRKIPEWWDN